MNGRGKFPRLWVRLFQISNRLVFCMTTLDEIHSDPERFQVRLSIDESEFLFRPLESHDSKILVDFINGLTKDTKRFYSYRDSASTIVGEIIQSINAYDKLRFLLEKVDGGIIVGMFEISFDIPQGDIERYKRYGIDLDSESDCRFGPVLADDFQSRNVGSQILPLITKVVKGFNQKRMILWGGVHTDNGRAVRFYEKNGFVNVGEFTNKHNLTCFDMMLDFRKDTEKVVDAVFD